MGFLLYSSHYMYLDLVTFYIHCSYLDIYMMMYVFHLYLTCVVSFLSLYACFLF